MSCKISFTVIPTIKRCLNNDNIVTTTTKNIKIKIKNDFIHTTILYNILHKMQRKIEIKTKKIPQEFNKPISPLNKSQPN